MSDVANNAAAANSTPVPLGDLSHLNTATLPGLRPAASAKPNSFLSSNPVFSYLNDVYTNISEHRKSLGLVNPGTIESLGREVSSGVFLGQFAFTGLRAELNKMFSPNFQTSHSLSIGSAMLPPYAFTAVYANERGMFQGNIDNDLSFSGRVNFGWNPSNISKATIQIAQGQPGLCQLEHDFIAPDFSVNFKTLNPSFLDGGFTGVATASLLQSLTTKFALGIEAVYSKQSAYSPPDAGLSYFARFNNGDWIASAQIQAASGAAIATLWRKVTDRVEAGVETKLSAGMKPVADPLTGGMAYQPLVQGETTIGAKYEYRSAVFRGQLDNSGKIAAFLEKRLTPTAALLFSGEIDHAKNAAKVGLGLQFEGAGSKDIYLMQNGLIDANGNPVPGAPTL